MPDSRRIAWRARSTKFRSSLPFLLTARMKRLKTCADQSRSSRHLVRNQNSKRALTPAAQEGTVADGLQSTQEQLWEDNWDDDDVEDDFQKQLRQAIAERAGGDDAMKE